MATITISRPERRNALRIETYAELAAALEEAGANDQVGVVVITTRVNELTALAGDPQIQANGYFERLPHPVLKEWMYVTTPLDFSRTPVSIRSCTPQPGENNDEVLAEWLGLSPQDVARFYEDEVI